MKHKSKKQKASIENVNVRARKWLHASCGRMKIATEE
jgi:hypothetical protein